MDTAAHGSNSLSHTLAAYATSLKYEDIPADVIARAKACMSGWSCLRRACRPGLRKAWCASWRWGPQVSC